MKHNITSPAHYKTGNIEVITILRKKLTREQFRGFCIGNIIKYTFRGEHKGGADDYRKAIQYLKWLIQEEEKNNGRNEHISN